MTSQYFQPHKAVPSTPRKPQEIKDARGTGGSVRKSEAKAGSIEPIRPPRKLSVEALEAWREIVPDLERYGYLRQTDAAMLGRYCELAAKHWRVERELREGNLTVKVSSSTMNERERVSPLFQMQADIERRMTAIEDRFGMSPMMRTSLLARLPGPPPVGLPKTEGSDVALAADDGSELDAIGFLN